MTIAPFTAPTATAPTDADLPAPFTFHGQRRRPTPAVAAAPAPAPAAVTSTGTAPTPATLAQMATRPRLTVVPPPAKKTYSRPSDAYDDLTDDLRVRFTDKVRAALDLIGMTEQEAAELVVDPDIVAPDPDGDPNREIRFGGEQAFVCSENADGFTYVIATFRRNLADGQAPESLREVARPMPRYAGAGNAGGTMPTSFEEIVEIVKDTPGWDIDESRGKHYRHIVSLDGRHRQPIPTSTSDYRSIRNLVAQLRAMGLDVRRPAGGQKR